MPDSFGKLTEDERLRATDFINDKAALEGDPCVVCGSLDTRVGDGLVGVPAQGMGGSKQESMLALPVVCHNCGFIRFFHAEALRLIPPTLPQTAERE